MSRRNRSALDVLLSVRRSRQEMEERDLCKVLADVRRLESDTQTLRSAQERLFDERRASSGMLLVAGEYQLQELQSQAIRQLVLQSEAELQRLEQMRLQQQVRFTEARSQSEAVSDLLARRRMRQCGLEKAADQRRSDDTFIAQIGQRRANAEESSEHIEARIRTYPQESEPGRYVEP